MATRPPLRGVDDSSDDMIKDKPEAEADFITVRVRTGCLSGDTEGIDILAEMG